MAEASNKLYQFIEQQKKELEKQVVSHGWVQGALVAKNKHLHKHNKHMLYFATEFSQPDRPHVTTTTTTKKYYCLSELHKGTDFSCAHV